MQAMKKFYDVVYRIVLVICKLLLSADILITTEAMVADKPEDKCGCGHSHGPDMGGMGGMGGMY